MQLTTILLPVLAAIGVSAHPHPQGSADLDETASYGIFAWTSADCPTSSQPSPINIGHRIVKMDTCIPFSSLSYKETALSVQPFSDFEKACGLSFFEDAACATAVDATASDSTCYSAGAGKEIKGMKFTCQ